MAEASAPEEFICPITKEMMAEPVCTADGQTYERAAIEQWFARGRTSSPITGLPLRSTTVTPNYALKNAIETYQKDRPQMEAMVHQVKDLQACLAECERELRRANVRAAASVPNAEYVLLMKRNKRPGDAALDVTDVKRCKRSGDDSSGSTDTGASGEHKYDDTVAAHKLWLQQWAATTERASAQALSERDELAKEAGACEGELKPTLAQAAREELRATALHKQMHALSEPLLQKEAERDAVGARVIAHTEPLGIDGCAMLAAIRISPAATWNGPLCTAYADLHCECLTLAGEKHSAHEAAMAAQKAGVELRLLAQGTKAKLRDLQSRLQLAEARVKAADLEAKAASKAVADFSEDDMRANASWAERVSWQPAAENLQKLAALREKCSAPLLSVRGSIASQLKRDGHGVSDLKTVGFTASELRETGCAAAELSGSFSSGELKDGGYTAKELKDIGLSLKQLKEGGFSACQLKDVGFSFDQLKEDGFTAGQLREAGFSLDKLKDSGFTAGQMKEGGFSVGQLRDAGFTLDQLKDGGFTAAQLMGVGAQFDQLQELGFSAGQMKEAGYTAGVLKDAGFVLDQLIAGAFGAVELKNAGFALDQLKEGGFTAAQLKEDGFVAAQLKGVGFTAAQLREAGFLADQLKEEGFTAAQLKEGGFTAGLLKACGFTVSELRLGGCTAAELKACGVTATACHEAGYKACDLFHLCLRLSRLQRGLDIVTETGFGSLDTVVTSAARTWYVSEAWSGHKTADDVKLIARAVQW